MLPVTRCEFVTIYAKDLAASRHFYVDVLGFDVIREKSGDFFQIDLAGTPLCVDHDTRGGHRNNIGLQVSDLEATAALLKRRGLEPRAGVNETSRESWLEIADPDGNGVIFLTRVQSYSKGAHS
jgi:catechol 2,3-dioxygenase-like lactoylglutathione lyase family enzyme